MPRLSQNREHILLVAGFVGYSEVEALPLWSERVRVRHRAVRQQKIEIFAISIARSAAAENSFSGMERRRCRSQDPGWRSSDRRA